MKYSQTMVLAEWCVFKADHFGKICVQANIG